MRGIYQIRIERPEKGALFYIGQAEVIERRQREHLNDLRAGRHYNGYLQAAFDKYGLSTEGWFSVLELVPEVEPLTPREQYWFDARVSETGRNQIMNAVRPIDGPMSNPDYRGRAIEASKAVTSTLEWKSAQAARNKQLAKSPAWKAAQDAGLARRNNDPAWKASCAEANKLRCARHYTITSPNGEIIKVYNLKEFCRLNHLDQGAMSRVVNGKKRSHKGWMRAE